MKVERVKGENKGKIMLYALSTCMWCRKTKRLLADLGVEYSYIFVDHLKGEDKEKVMKEVERWNPRGSFPTLVINDKTCIIGFKEEQIREVIEE